MLRVRVRVTSDIATPSFRSLMIPINGALSLRDLMNKILAAAGVAAEIGQGLLLHVDGFALSLDERTEDLLRDDDLVFLSSKEMFRNMETMPCLGKRGIEYLDQEQSAIPRPLQVKKEDQGICQKLEPSIQKIEVVQSPNLLPPRSKKVPIIESTRPEPRKRALIPSPSSSSSDSSSDSDSDVPPKPAQKRKVTFQQSPVTVEKNKVTVPLSQPLNVFARRPQMNGTSLFHRPQNSREIIESRPRGKQAQIVNESKGNEEQVRKQINEVKGEEIKEAREERKEDQIFTKKSKQDQEKERQRLQSERSELTNFVWDSIEKGSQVSLQYQYLDETNCEPSITGWRNAVILQKEENSITIVEETQGEEPIQLTRSDIITLKLKPKKKEPEESKIEEQQKVVEVPSVAKPSILRRLKSQIEYYFSDANYYKDIFLRKLEDPERFIPLKEIMKFRRVSNLTRTLTHVQTALEYSKVVELSQDKLRVRKNLTGIS